MNDTRIHPEDIEELVDRVRRIETRLTRYMTENGFDTHVQRPRYDRRRQRLAVPSRGVSLAECIRAIPPDTVGGVAVYIGEDHLATITVN